MTVPQAKGLEFADIFIVNFFADSPLQSEWRALLDILQESGAGGGGDDDVLPPTAAAQPPAADDPGAVLDAAARAAGYLRPLAFDAAKHTALCEELKHLYTAITRAKCNVGACSPRIRQAPTSDR